MKIRIFMVALLATSMALPTCKKTAQDVITVQFSVGDVKIVSAGGEKAARAGETVSFEDSIVTGASSFVDINFGTRGVIRLVENSRVKMTALKTETGTDQVQFDMDRGKILVVMAKLSKESGFSVKTRTTIAAIRGTSFMVVSDPNDSRIYVLKGKILVQLAREGKLAAGIEKMLEADKKIVVSEDLAGEIIAGKKQLEAVPMTPKESADIRKEIKEMKINEKLDQDALKEFNEITSEAEKKTGGTQGTMKRQDAPKDIQSIPSL
ncbi:MAG TPA: FecR family protein [Spirochaetota bacterium]|nr:FecR family protein [Spirochaetota bacterium]HPV40870.1 FecR family protein [Spirochaetota bacterium]